MKMIKEEIRLIFTAIMFYTQIRAPKWVGYSSENLNKSTKYFPVIGWLVGSLTAIIFWLAVSILPISVSIIISMIAGILITGAFHEDGFADFCDGFGGGWTKEKILEIMKDSRNGTYGTVGLVLILLFKFALLSSIQISLIPVALIIAHTLSRLSAVFVIYNHDYARADLQSKTKPIGKGITGKNLIFATLLGIMPIFLLNNYLFFTIIIPVYIIQLIMGRYITKWLGGFTGDCLGAIQQINEIIIYTSMLVLWKYI